MAINNAVEFILQSCLLLFARLPFSNSISCVKNLKPLNHQKFQLQFFFILVLLDIMYYDTIQDLKEVCVIRLVRFDNLVGRRDSMFEIIDNEDESGMAAGTSVFEV